MGPEIVAAFIPVIIFLIPIVHILTKHQQKMAEIIHGQGANMPQLEEMRREILELRNLVNQQTLAIDSLDSRVRALPDRQITTSQ